MRIGSGGVATAVPLPFLSPGRDVATEIERIVSAAGQSATKIGATEIGRIAPAAGQQPTGLDGLSYITGRGKSWAILSAAVLCCAWHTSLEG